MDPSWSFATAPTQVIHANRISVSSSIAPNDDDTPVILIGRDTGEVGEPDDLPDEDPALSYNTLNPKERVMLVRKNRKLAQIFGADPVGSPFTPTTQARRDHLPSHWGAAPLDPEPNSDAISSLSLPPSPVSPSFENEADVERRQKRARLAKLDRHLGGGVPSEMVLGITQFMRDLDLPETPVVGPAEGPQPEDKSWRSLTWRRKSMMASLPSRETTGGDRLKEDLSEKEKAAKVKRALKMEKVFGDKPPQELIQTRPYGPDGGEPQMASGSGQAARSALPRIRPSMLAKRRTSTESTESSQHLLSSEGETFRRYRDSLNSLSELVERDDRRSIAAIHHLLRSSDEWDGSDNAPAPERAETTKKERRRSLPITRQDSLLSLRSVASVAPSPEQADFQVRRKRAAKLAGFFGVDYHQLFEDVLAAFELGVAEETGRGSLRPHETEMLLDKLRRLKAQNVQK